jgi:hypothetical protein
MKKVNRELAPHQSRGGFWKKSRKDFQEKIKNTIKIRDIEE